MKPTMPINQFKPGDFPALAEIKAGDKLVADGGFPCLAEGEICDVQQDEDGLYVICEGPDGEEPGTHHYLDGQEGENGECVGLWRVPQ